MGSWRARDVISKRVIRGSVLLYTAVKTPASFFSQRAPGFVGWSWKSAHRPGETIRQPIVCGSSWLRRATTHLPTALTHPSGTIVQPNPTPPSSVPLGTTWYHFDRRSGTRGLTSVTLRFVLNGTRYHLKRKLKCIEGGYGNVLPRHPHRCAPRGGTGGTAVPLIEIDILGELDAEPPAALLPGNLLLSHCDATVGIANVAFQLCVHFCDCALESVTM